jgi:signal transduction histidine kinase
MKTRYKIAFLLVVTFTSLILVFSAFLYYFVERYSYQDFYKRLQTRCLITSKINLYNESDQELLQKFKGEYLERLEDEQDYIFELKPANSLLKIARDKNLNESFLRKIILNGRASFQEKNKFYFGIKASKNNKEYIVITAASNYYYNNHMNYFLQVLTASILIVIFFSILIAYWLSKNLINPVKQISQKVNSIGTDNLYERIEGEEKEDELGELIRTFNDMLRRLETSFETQNNFISNASHELNTPLTSIIGEADVTLTRDRSTEEYKEALENVLSEAEKLDKKIKALLYLAQTGFNSKNLEFKKVRIDQLLFDVQETMKKIYPSNKIHIDLSSLPESPEKLKIKGNEHLLHLALSNVLINACKYSNNEVVEVSIGWSSTHLIILVVDKGIGIPENELVHIYDPFFRASNTTNFEGYGIGLPLTRNIIKIHGGELIVSSKKDEGTTVRINLPVGNYKLE